MSQAQSQNMSLENKDDKPANPKRNFWKKEEEDLLKDWADKAQCYKWMHLKSHEKYRSKNAWFTIPVIIISTFTGTANFAQDRFPEEYKSMVVMGVGALNIIAGIVTTISQFLKISEMNEAHRVASLSWDKFYRNLKTELAKNPLDRFPPHEMIKISKEEYDRLVEISPMVPNDVIENFNRTFKRNHDVIRPDLCGELHTTTIYEISEEERKLLYEPPKEERKITEKQKTSKKIVNARVEQFRNTFFQLNKRYPTEEEIKNKFETIYDNDEYTKADFSSQGVTLDSDSEGTPSPTPNTGPNSSPNLNLNIEDSGDNDSTNDGSNNDGDNNNGDNNDNNDNNNDNPDSSASNSTTI